MKKTIRIVLSALIAGVSLWSCTKDLEQKVDSLAQQVSELSIGKIPSIETQMAAVQNTIKTLASQANLDAVNAKVASLEENQKALQTKVAAMDADITKLQNADKSFQEALDRINTTIGTLVTRGEFEAAKSEIDSAMKGLSEQLEAAQKAIESLGEKEADDIRKLQDLQAELEAKLELCAKAADLEALRTDFEALKGTVGAINASLGNLEADFASYKAQTEGEIASIGAEIDGMKTAIANNSAAIEKLSSLYETLAEAQKADIEDLDTYKKAMASSIETINNALDMISGSVDQTKKALEALKESLKDYVTASTFESTVAGLATKQELAVHIADYEAQVKAYNEFVKAYETKMGSVTEDIKGLKTAVSNLNSAIDDLQKEDAAIKKSISDLSDALADAIDEISDAYKKAISEESKKLVESYTKAIQSEIEKVNSKIQSIWDYLNGPLAAQISFLSSKIDGMVVLYTHVYMEKAYSVLVPVKVNPSNAAVDTSAFSITWDPVYITKGIDPSRYLKIAKVYTPAELMSEPRTKSKMSDIDLSGVYGLVISWESDFDQLDMPIFVEYSYTNDEKEVSTVTSATPVIISEIYRTLCEEDVPQIDTVVLWKDELDTVNVAMLNNYWYTYLESITMESSDENIVGVEAMFDKIAEDNTFQLSNTFSLTNIQKNFGIASIYYSVTDKGQEAVEIPADPYRRTPAIEIPAIKPVTVSKKFKALAYMGNDSVENTIKSIYIPEEDIDVEVDVKELLSEKLDICKEFGWTVAPEEGISAYIGSVGGEEITLDSLSKTISSISATADKISYKILTTADVCDKSIVLRFTYDAQNAYRACKDTVKLIIDVPVSVKTPAFHFNVKTFDKTWPSKYGIYWQYPSAINVKNYSTKNLSYFLNTTQVNTYKDMPVYTKDTVKFFIMESKESDFVKNYIIDGNIMAPSDTMWKSKGHDAEVIEMDIHPEIALVGGQVINDWDHANYYFNRFFSPITVRFVKHYINKINLIGANYFPYLLEKGKVNPEAKLSMRYNIYDDMNEVADTTAYGVVYSCESVVLNESGTVDPSYYNVRLLNIDESGEISLNTKDYPNAQELVDNAPLKYYQAFRVTATDLWGNILTRDWKVYLKAETSSGSTEKPDQKDGNKWFKDEL